MYFFQSNWKWMLQIRDNWCNDSIMKKPPHEYDKNSKKEFFSLSDQQFHYLFHDLIFVMSPDDSYANLNNLCWVTQSNAVQVRPKKNWILLKHKFHVFGTCSVSIEKMSKKFICIISILRDITIQTKLSTSQHSAKDLQNWKSVHCIMRICLNSVLLETLC